MSVGDFDNHLGSLEELARLRKDHPDFDAYLRRSPEYDFVYDVPYGAGITTDGSTVLVDRHLDPVYQRKGGRPIDLVYCLATHERTEWGLRRFCKIGVDYEHDPAGHRLANAAEKQKVEGLGLTWAEYNEFIEPQIKGMESERLTKLCPDMARYPYRGTKIAKLL